jgi:hypothetical protein
VKSGDGYGLPSMYGNVIQLCTDSLINKENYINENAVFSTILNTVAEAEGQQFLGPITEDYFASSETMQSVKLIPDRHIRDIVPHFISDDAEGEEALRRHMNHWTMDSELMNPTLDVDITEYKSLKNPDFFKSVTASKCKSYRKEVPGGISYLPFNLSVLHARQQIYFKQEDI